MTFYLLIFYMKNHDVCKKLDPNILKNDFFMAIFNFVSGKLLLLRALSWTHEIACKIPKNNIFARFFCLVTFRRSTMNFICIFYYPSVKWLDAGAILVMRAMMAPPRV